MAERRLLVSFRVEGELWRAFQVRCGEAGVSASAVLRGLIGGFLEGQVRLPAARGPVVAESPTGPKVEVPAAREGSVCGACGTRLVYKFGWRCPECGWRKP